MKRLFLLSFLLLAGSNLYAQSSPPVCGIYYDYDAVGQRIKRSYDCRELEDDGEKPANRGSSTSQQMPTAVPVSNAVTTTATAPIKVFPNPTPGPYTIALSEAPEKPVHFHWYNEKGQILTSGTISAQNTTGNIAAWADGTYLLQVYLPLRTESFRVVKITSAH